MATTPKALHNQIKLKWLEKERHLNEEDKGGIQDLKQ